MAWLKSIRLRYTLRATFVAVAFTSLFVAVAPAAQDVAPAAAERETVQRESQANDPAVSRRVAELIFVFRDPEARGNKLAQTSKAIDELVKIGPSAVPLLVHAILTGQDAESSYSALALDEIGKPAVEAVRKLWEAMGEASRWKLMRFLGKHDYDAALEFALASLDSRDENVRYEAIRYAGQYKEVKAREKLLKMLNTDVPRLRWAVVDALTPIGGDEVVDAFINLLSPDSWAAKGEGLTPPPGYAPPWWPDGRPVVIKALGSLKSRKAAPALVKLLHEPGRGTGYLGPIIIPVLREIDYREAVPELRRILATDATALSSSHEPGAIHAASAAALWQFGDRLGRASLIQMWLSGVEGIGPSTREAFRELCDKADIWMLARFLPGKFSCEALERITGIENRAPGWAVVTEHDGPLWVEWYRKHERELPRMTFPRRETSGSASDGKKITGAADPSESPTPLEHDERETIWASLASDNYVASFRSMLRLLRSPEDAVGFLDQRLRPPGKVDPKRVRQLVADLDANEVSVRDAAEKELRQMGEPAREQLLVALNAGISPEARLRVERLTAGRSDPFRMREVRAISVLEMIGTPEALKVLRRLVETEGGSHIALEAAAASEHLDKRACCD